MFFWLLKIILDDLACLKNTTRDCFIPTIKKTFILQFIINQTAIHT
jgi:hypothetical protein